MQTEDALRVFEEHKEAGVGTQPVVGIRTSLSQAVLISFRRCSLEGLTGRRGQPDLPIHRVGHYNLTPFLPSLVIKIGSSG